MQVDNFFVFISLGLAVDVNVDVRRDPEFRPGISSVGIGDVEFQWADFIWSPAKAC